MTNWFKDCTCPINAEGYLKNECDEDGIMKRIRHRSMGTKNWAEARFERERWLEWGQTTRPVDGIDKLKRKNATISEGINFFFEFTQGLELARPTIRRRGLMLAAFYIGTVLFTADAITKLR